MQTANYSRPTAEPKKGELLMKDQFQIFSKKVSKSFRSLNCFKYERKGKEFN